MRQAVAGRGRGCGRSRYRCLRTRRWRRTIRTGLSRWSCPYPPGGGVDAMARVVAEKLSGALGQQVVVDNRAGGSGLVGTRAFIKSAARRLHAVPRPHRLDLDQSQPLRQFRLRSAQGLRADRADRVDAGRAAGASVVPGEDDRRGGRDRQEGGRQVQHRHVGGRHRRLSLRRIVQVGHRHRRRHHPVQGHRRR